jgi:hypothetical protein
MAKDAVAKSWTIKPSSDGKRWSEWQSGDKYNVTSGLTFPSNGAANSDIRLVWSGADLLSRTSHTVIWKANYVQQNGYYAVTWHSPNTGTWDGGDYSSGMHPFPCDGTFNSNGSALGGTGSTGAVHYQEIAGSGAPNDYIASPSSPGPQDSFLVTKGVWYTCARVIEIVGGTAIRYTFYPDVDNNPTKFIRQESTLASLTSPANPAFYIGASDWTASGNTNSETPSGTLRYFKLFSAALSIADIQTEAASNSDAPATSAGSAAKWYSNINPTPTDVTDKSSAGHSPAWANANRPTLYTG